MPPLDAADLSFDDLIPAQNQGDSAGKKPSAADLSFDDLIPSAEQQAATAAKYAGWDTPSGPPDQVPAGKKPWMADEPGYYYGQVLPFRENEKTGAVEWGYSPESARAPIRGLQINPLTFDINDPQQRSDLGAAAAALGGFNRTPAIPGPASAGPRMSPGAGPRTEPPPVQGGPKGPDAPPGGGPSAEPAAPPSTGPTLALPAPEEAAAPAAQAQGQTLALPAPAVETSTPAERAKAPDPADTRTQVTFFDQKRGEVASANLVGIRPDGIHVVDQGGGAYTFVHPGSILNTREVAVPAAEASTAPDTKAPAPEGPTSPKATPKAETPTVRPVTQIQAEDGVGLGTAVQTHEAEKEAAAKAQTPTAEQAVTTTKPDEPDTENAHGGPWESAGKNANGETVYKNPDGARATFVDGVPWMGAPGGSDDDNKRLKVVADKKGKRAETAQDDSVQQVGKAESSTQAATTESVTKQDAPHSREDYIAAVASTYELTPDDKELLHDVISNRIAKGKPVTFESLPREITDKIGHSELAGLKPLLANPQLVLDALAGDTSRLAPKQQQFDPAPASAEANKPATSTATTETDKPNTTPIVRPVAQIQAEDGVGLGPAVKTHEAEKEAAEQAKPKKAAPKPVATTKPTLSTDRGAEGSAETGAETQAEPEASAEPQTETTSYPVLDGQPIDPESLQRDIDAEKKKERLANGAAARARKPASKAAHQKAAAESKASAEAKQAVLNAWNAVHPDGAASVESEPPVSTPSAATLPIRPDKPPVKREQQMRQTGPFVTVPKEPKRLIQFLKESETIGTGIHARTIPGGLRDVGGDVAAAIGGPKGRPGLINNRSGRHLDAATQRAWDAGYFPEHDERPDINTLLDAIREDHTGTARYSMYDQDAVEAYRYAQDHNTEIARLASQTGIEPRGKTREQFFDAVADHLSLEDMARAVIEADQSLADEYADFEQRSKQHAAARGETWNPDAFYDNSQARTFEDLENEYRQENDVASAQQRAGGDAEPGPARPPSGGGEEGGQQGRRSAGPDGRDGPEEGAGDDGADDGFPGGLAERRPPLPPATGPDLFAVDRTPEPEREAEPKIRTDQRQETMPGMEPTARQAQASRDAAGPRSDQMPANQGLFARPETEQPSLLARPVQAVKSRWAAAAGVSPRFKDEIETIPGDRVGHETAAQWVLARGAADGFEHMAIVENATGRIVHAGTDGKPDSIGFDPRWFMDKPGGYTVHHNHPRNTALSQPDLWNLANRGISHVVAIGARGLTSWAKAGKLIANRLARTDGSTDALDRLMAQVMTWTKGAERVANDLLWRLMSDGNLTGAAAIGHFADVINRILNAHGVIEYHSTNILPLALQDALRVKLKELRYDLPAINRSTHAVQPSERISGLPQPVRDGAREGSAGGARGAGQGAGLLGGERSSGGGVQGRLLEDQGGLSESSGLPVPLYSAVARAADALKQSKGTGEQMLAAISKTPGVKPEELDWIGLPDWLKGQKSVTKEAIQDFIRANALDVREVTKGVTDDSALRALEPEIRALGINKPLAQIDTQDIGDAGGSSSLKNRWWQAKGEYDAALRRRGPNATKFDKYKLPGGKNYREMLITLPRREVTTGDVAQRLFGKPMANLSEAERDQVVAEMGRAHDASAQDYRSSHWDEPNVLAHTRFSERTAPDGARVLLVEEVQSDWMQDARKLGMAGDHAALESERDRLAGEVVDLSGDSGPDLSNPEIHRRMARITEINQLTPSSAPVPAAPFRTSWPMLVMKRMIKYAVDNGFDRVAWSPGEVHADRYSLAKQISRIEWGTLPGETDGGSLVGYDKNGDAVISRPAKPAELPDLIGKEVAEKLLASDVNHVTQKGLEVRRLSGLDLKVGGEGMKGFYDSILPKETNKIVGKYGAKVGRSEIEVDNPEHNVDLRTGRDNGKPEQIGAPVHSFDITDKLRDAVQTEGMALFERKRGRGGEAGASGPATTPVVPRPASAPQVSRWPNGAGSDFTDMLHLAPERGHDAAADWVVEHGRRTGHEHIAVVDNWTGEIVHAGTNGRPDSLDFDHANTAGDRDRYTIHHSHPGSTALSYVDLGMLANAGISHALAHGHDGTTTRASLGNGLINPADRIPTAIRRNRQTLIDAYNEASAKARSVIQFALDRGTLTRDEADHYWNDVTNRLLHARGVIDYVSGIKLPLAIRAALRGKLRSMGHGDGFVYRNTESVLATERSRGLPGAERIPTQPRSAGLAGGRGAGAQDAGRDGRAGGQGRLGEQEEAVARRQTETPEFKRWFGDSKVVDAAGKPLVVYHGTTADFDAFSKKFRGSATGARDAKRGFFFTDSPKVASDFTPIIRDGDLPRTTSAPGSNLMPVHLKMENPAEWDWGGGVVDGDTLNRAIRDARKEGHDGLIITKIRDGGFMPNHGSASTHYIVFEPNQIKSAIGNRGTFDPKNPSILAERGGEQFKPPDPLGRGLAEGSRNALAVITRRMPKPASPNALRALPPMRGTPKEEKMPLIAYHGSSVADLAALDASKIGTGGFVGKFAPGYTPEPHVYLATEPTHAAYYGAHVHKFLIDAPLLEKDAVPALESWAKELGFGTAQEMIDQHFDGSAYDALNADEYFLEAMRQARDAGMPGAKVSFGNLKDSVSGRKRPIGDVIILNDPSVATKVSD